MPSADILPAVMPNTSARRRPVKVKVRMIPLSRRPTGVAGTMSRSRWICSPLSPRAAPAVTFGRSSASQGLEETTVILIG